MNQQESDKIEQNNDILFVEKNENNKQNIVPKERPQIYDLFGFIRNVDSVPTHTPRDFSEQFVIYNDGSTSKLYWYDVENNVWGNSGTSFYFGNINDDGTAISLPSGWSSTRSSTGIYTITHNLGTTDYIVISSTGPTNSLISSNIYEKETNYFSISCFNYAGSNANVKNMFILVKY